MQIQILGGVYVDTSPDFRTALPRNFIPTPKDTGISKGYFRPADGLVEFASNGPGIGRGAIVWNGVLYAVMGNSLVRVTESGGLSVLGSIAGAGTVTMDYSFDCLGIAGGGILHYFEPSQGVTTLTDPDAGTVLDAMFLDGYWLITDGSYIAQTELNDRYSVLTTKYGSSEADPDPIVALWRLKDELVALNRNTSETFQNVGGTGFAFQRQPSALINAGPIGTHMVCEFSDALAIVGGARNEPPSVYLIGGGDRVKLATPDVEKILAGYSESVLSQCLLEARNHLVHELLYLHLPDRTLVYDIASSKAWGLPVWYELCSALDKGQYRARHWIWAYGRWIVSDPGLARLGAATDDLSSHYGDVIGWELNSGVIYGEGRNAIVHELELVSLPGRVPLGVDPTIWTSYSLDGDTWSQERPIKAGKQGERTKRLKWLQQGLIGHFRVQKFRGTSDAHLPIIRLEARLEPLAV